MEQKPLSRLERIKAEKEKYPVKAVKKKDPVPVKPGKGAAAPVTASRGGKGLSEKSIEAIAKALQFMMKE